MDDKGDGGLARLCGETLNHHRAQVHTHGANAANPAEVKDHARRRAHLLPRVGLVQSLLDLVHRATHVLVLLEGLRAYAVGEEKLRVEGERAHAA